MQNQTIQLDSKSLIRHGFSGDLHYPTLLLSLSVDPELINAELFGAINCCLASALHLEEKPLLTEDDRVESVLDAFLLWVHEVQIAANWPVFEKGRIITTHDQKSVFDIAIPVIRDGHGLALKIAEWCSSVFNRKFSGQSLTPLLGQLQPLIATLRAVTPADTNTNKFLKAALALHIPFTAMTRDIYQFGYGYRTRLLCGSFTDETSWVGHSLAKNKFLSTLVLREAGLPVPLNMLANDLNTALSAARELGYPVVVKPIDCEQGAGVSVGLTTQDEVKKAFNKAKRYSETLLVEKHVEGRDYRLVVFRGELIWAIERVPASVTGDGSKSVRELVDVINSDPRRGNAPHLSLKNITLDAEALSLLAKQGQDANSVPESGEFVKLRQIANISAGGMPVTVFDRVHPDNQRLAIRTAALLCLDLAGIDILMPDISRSWLETGGAICEVNAQPQLGSITSSHLYPAILKKYISGNGRIPVVVIVGADPTLGLCASVEREVRATGLSVGIYDGRGASRAGNALTARSADAYHDIKALSCDRSVEAMVVTITDDSIVLSGLPLQYFDVLLIAGTHLDAYAQNNEQSGQELLNTIVSAILPLCDGEIISLSGTEVTMQSTAQQQQAQRVLHAVPPEQGIAEVVRALHEAKKRHDNPC